MKASNEQVVNAILFFAKLYGQEKNYEALIEAYNNMPKIIEMIVYEMFLQKFNSYYCPDKQYKQYKIIHEYATELKEKGWVTYESTNPEN
jgi:hypothetical protein